MKKLTFILMLGLALITHAQDGIYIDEDFCGLPMRNAPVKEIKSEKELPVFIQKIIRQLFDSSMTDFTNKISFSMGQIIDLDGFLKTDSTFQLTYMYVIPKYELFFELKDTSISVKNYCFELSLDQFGQILRFQWPRKGFNKRKDFVKGIVFKTEAQKYALRKNYKIKSPVYHMFFNEDTNTLQWHVSFVQKSTGNEKSSFKVYRSVVFDANSKKALRDHEWSQTSIAD